MSLHKPPDGGCTFDTTSQFSKDARMSRLSQKIIAVLFAIWLPLFSGSALATSVLMQVPAGHCQDESMQMADMDGMDDMHAMSGDSDEGAAACSSCGVCHLACSAYLAVPALSLTLAQTATSDITPYLLAYRSYTSAPLLPPPLALV